MTRFHAHPSIGIVPLEDGEWPKAAPDDQFPGDWPAMDDDVRDDVETAFFSRLLLLIAQRWPESIYEVDLPYPGQENQLRTADPRSQSGGLRVVRGALTLHVARVIPALTPEVVDIFVGARLVLHAHGGWSGVGLELTADEASEFATGLAT